MTKHDLKSDCSNDLPWLHIFSAYTNIPFATWIASTSFSRFGTLTCVDLSIFAVETSATIWCVLLCIPHCPPFLVHSLCSTNYNSEFYTFFKTKLFPHQFTGASHTGSVATREISGTMFCDELSQKEDKV